MVQFIRALPGAGKTWLAQAQPGRYLDGDVTAEVYDAKSASTFEERIMGSDDKKAKFLRALELQANGRVVLSNFEPIRLNVPDESVIHRFAYKPDEYVNHLELAGRKDLLSRTGPDQLRQWAEHYKNLSRVVYLNPGEYIADALSSNPFK